MAEAPGLVKALVEEPWDFLIDGFILAFLWQTFSYQLAGVYLILVMVHAFSYVFLKPTPKLNFNSVRGNTGKAVLVALVTFGIFIGVSTLVINFFQAAAKLTLGQMLVRMSSATFGAASAPILESNPWAIFIIGAILIPKWETKTLIATMMEILSRIFKVQLGLRSVATWILFAVVSGIGVIFHFQAKGLKDGVALTLVGLFWLTSCILIVKEGESESAVYLHMINNGWTLIRALV